ncbi:IS6 family transposase, partial [Escherichia coli]|nr:IS6 family transposase [Escherichia coli]
MNPFQGRYLPRYSILCAVRWYSQYGLIYRDLHLMLAVRVVNVDHSTLFRLFHRYPPYMEIRLRWYWR